MARVAVLGAGGVGSMAALELSRAGHDVTLFEQFEINHDRGSSYGTSRIIRRTYPDPLYTGMMDHAYRLWDEFERESAATVFHRCGGLFFGRDDGEMKRVVQSLAEHAVPHEVLRATDVARRFPAFVLRDHELATYEPGAGYLDASRCVQRAVACAQARGARLQTGVRVRAIEPKALGIEVQFENASSVVFDRVVLSSGAWNPMLLARFAKLPLTPSRQVYCHFEIGTLDVSFEPGRMPIWIDYDSLHYGFPSDGVVPGVKVAEHRPGITVDPDHVERTITDADRDGLRAYLQQRIPGLRPTVLAERVCLYTNTPDEDFVIDTLPGDSRVVVIAGLSGHGFKFVSLLGWLAARLALGEDPRHPLKRFAMARFGLASS